MVVWAVCKDPSGVQTILPIVNELKGIGKEVVVITNGKATELINKKDFAAASALEVIEQLSLPEAMVTSMCSEGGVGRDLVPLLRERKIPSVAVQDFWGAYVDKDTTDNSWSDQVYRPNTICVGDEYARRLVIAAWPDFYLENIRITGFPAMDKYVAYDSAAAVDTVRRNFNLLEHKIILYLGDCLPGTSQMLAEVVAVLDCKMPICLITRKHPRMKDQVPEEFLAWKQVENDFPCQDSCRLVTDSTAYDLPALIAAADLVISNPLSSTPIDAAHLRKDNIVLFYPVVQKQFEAYQGDQMKEVPVVALGCSRQVINRQELKEAVSESLAYGLGLTENQKKHFRADGKNSERVARVVEELEKLT